MRLRFINLIYIIFIIVLNIIINHEQQHVVIYRQCYFEFRPLLWAYNLI